MSQETFLACDNPACAKATRLESDEADSWLSLEASFSTNDEEGDPEELSVDACSIECLVAAVGPATLAAYLRTEPAT